MEKQKTKFKQTEIGRIPEDWEERKIGEFGKIYSFLGIVPMYHDVPKSKKALEIGLKSLNSAKPMYQNVTK